MTERFAEGSEELAIRLEDGCVLSNANSLEWCGTHLAWGGSRTSNYGQTLAQEILEKAGAIPVPFNVFKEANLDILQARIIEKTPSETVNIQVERWENGKQVKKDEKRHYVGACILEVAKNYFLFDIDREELKHKILNPFVVKLPQACKNIEEAYISLKPAKVTMAEIQGIPIERQGEWFFVKRSDELPKLPKPPQELKEVSETVPDARKMGATKVENYYKPGFKYGYEFPAKKLEETYYEKVEKWEAAVEKIRSYSPQEGELRQGGNRPNTVEQYVAYAGMVLVSGDV